jgi:hypothetical protein
MAARIADLESELAYKDNKLLATGLQLCKAQDIKAKDIQLLVRPTELEHSNVKEA